MPIVGEIFEHAHSSCFNLSHSHGSIAQIGPVLGLETAHPKPNYSNYPNCLSGNIHPIGFSGCPTNYDSVLQEYIIVLMKIAMGFYLKPTVS